MKSFTLLFVFLLALIHVSPTQQAHAQALKTMADNGVWGTSTGVSLALAVSVLQNDYSADTFRIGLGSGILFGLAVGGWDLYQMGSSGGYMVNGFLNTSGSTSQVIALDLAYGALAGSLLGFAVNILADKNIIEGLKLGAAYGAFTGFAFGIVDAFFLSRSGGGGFFMTENNVPVKGFFTYHPTQNVGLGFIAPEMYQNVQFTTQGPHMGITSGVNLAHLNIRF